MSSLRQIFERFLFFYLHNVIFFLTRPSLILKRKCLHLQIVLQALLASVTNSNETKSREMNIEQFSASWLYWETWAEHASKNTLRRGTLKNKERKKTVFFKFSSSVYVHNCNLQHDFVCFTTLISTIKWVNFGKLGASSTHFSIIYWILSEFFLI